MSTKTQQEQESVVLLAFVRAVKRRYDLVSELSGIRAEIRKVREPYNAQAKPFSLELAKLQTKMGELARDSPAEDFKATALGIREARASFDSVMAEFEKNARALKDEAKEVSAQIRLKDKEIPSILKDAFLKSLC